MFSFVYSVSVVSESVVRCVMFGENVHRNRGANKKKVFGNTDWETVLRPSC